MISTILWPYALKAASITYSQLHLNKYGLSPEQRFSGYSVQPLISNRHPCACPVFVMTDPARENESPKWDPKSRVGIYLGHSSTHAGLVALVLNPKMLYVSPQYHVVFNDHFTTVPSMRDGTIPENWLELVKENENINLEDGNDLAKLWTSTEYNIDVDQTSGSQSFNDSDSIQTEVTSNLSSTKSSSPESNLLMPTMPDLNELTSRRSG